jgi:hypothetical protein
MPAVQRTSIRTLRPSTHPNCCSPCTSTLSRACASGSSATRFISTPIRRIRSVCCARAASGHAAAAPPSSVMKLAPPYTGHRASSRLGAAGLPPAQPAAERPKSPLARPEMFLSGFGCCRAHPKDSTSEGGGECCTAELRAGVCPLWVKSGGDDRAMQRPMSALPPKADK